MCDQRGRFEVTEKVSFFCKLTNDDNRLIDLETGIILIGKGKSYDKFEELKPKAKIIFKKLGLC